MSPFHIPAPLAGSRAEDAARFLDLAAGQARLAQCTRANCGSVIVAAGGLLIGAGFNGPPSGTEPRCGNRTLPAGFKSDRTCCIHAEARAIDDARAHFPQLLAGATLYFARVDDAGRPLLSGAPYCTICSKAAAEAGLASFVLAHVNGTVAYPAAVYNELSFAWPGPYDAFSFSGGPAWAGSEPPTALR